MWKVMFLTVLATLPSSTNYTLKAYDFGNGTNSSNSSNYNLRGSAGATSGSLASSSYTLPAGIRASTTVPTPSAPTFTNPDNSYDRLRVTLNVGAFPSDTKYAIAISDDNFTTTKYVKSDQTISTNFSVSNYQTYTAWGSAGGIWIVGLANSTTYKVKVAALQGSATGSGFGPSASAATLAPSVTFALTTSLTFTPPFSSTFASLAPGSVFSGDATVTTTITTNAEQGGAILVKDQNAGLTSSTTSYTISSTTADLSAANNGYGAQISATSQTSGAPMVAVSPYNGTSNSVGGLTSSFQQLVTFAGPVTTGVVTFALKAKTDASTPTASNYTDAITLSVSLLF